MLVAEHTEQDKLAAKSLILSMIYIYGKPLLKLRRKKKRPPIEPTSLI